MVKSNPTINIFGFSLVEAILAIALFGLFATALLGLLMNSYGSNFQAEEKDQATLYAQQGVEAVWSIRRQAWNLLINGTYGLDNIGGYWQFFGSSDLINDKYTRTVVITDVCRDVGGDIVDCPGGTIDLNTKKALVNVSYSSITGMTNEIELTAYLTTWQSSDWVQTDWSGGAGQTVWSDATRYDSDDNNIDEASIGEVKLASSGGGGGGCGSQVWLFNTAGDYTYDPAKIEVIGGFAQLKGVVGGSSGSTTNSSFNTEAAGWTYSDWNQGGGEANVTGTRQGTGGNPGGWVDINIPSDKNDEVGGFWSQAFNVTENNSTATLNFDWHVLQYNALPITFKMYVFVDTAAGDPVIGMEVWSSGEITAVQNWASLTNINVSSKVAAAGTYYLKVAVWVETDSTKTGPFTVGYDNVLLSWSSTAVSYPTDRPTINPNSSYSPGGVDIWSSFTETATKNGGEIYYQLSDDDGASWQYWNGSAWVSAGAGNYNTAVVVDANIGTFNVSSAQIMFKAFLESNGSQLVQLDQVQISCAQFYSWPFDTPSNYNYNSSKIEVTSGVAQLLSSSGLCSGTATACNTLSSQLTCQSQGGCSWTGGSSVCQNAGSCSAASNLQCSSCPAAGCAKVTGKCSGTLNCSVYLDETSCVTCSQCSWVVGAGSCSGTATACNTLSSQLTCQSQGGCSWTGGTYPTDRPSINPVASYTAAAIESWSSFAETATKNGGEIYYQLSSDDGASWQYWNGSAWANAGAESYNIATVINTNINSFTTSTAKIMFKAFLESNGTQLVRLDNVRIGWGQTTGGVGYATSGYLVSSAFNTVGVYSSFNIVEWDETIPACSPVCSVKLQVRSAPDSGGSPGAWSSWYGALGSGDYFTDSTGTIIPIDLNFNQWVQYRLELAGDGVDTPICQEIRINYTP